MYSLNPKIIRGVRLDCDQVWLP